MVRGLLGACARLVAVSALLGVVALAAAPGAGADNRRVAIGDYQWSLPEVRIDLGEHVTWHWVGPETIHSVTGDSPNARGIDSDPTVSLPNHPLGDSFQVAFDSPGAYTFACKLHSSVRGTVTVSDTPGDPGFEPDPVPANRVDRRAPSLREIALEAKTVHRRGVRLSFALDERAKVDAEYFRIDRRGRRSYAGYERWRRQHIGFNDVRFGSPGEHFKARPGRYLAKLTASDVLDNTSRPRKLRFRIRPRG